MKLGRKTLLVAAVLALIVVTTLNVAIFITQFTGFLVPEPYNLQPNVAYNPQTGRLEVTAGLKQLAANVYYVDVIDFAHAAAYYYPETLQLGGFRFDFDFSQLTIDTGVAEVNASWAVNYLEVSLGTDITGDGVVDYVDGPILWLRAANIPANEPTMLHSINGLYDVWVYRYVNTTAGIDVPALATVQDMATWVGGLYTPLYMAEPKYGGIWGIADPATVPSEFAVIAIEELLRHLHAAYGKTAVLCLVTTEEIAGAYQNDQTLATTVCVSYDGATYTYLTQAYATLITAMDRENVLTQFVVDPAANQTTTTVTIQPTQSTVISQYMYASLDLGMQIAPWVQLEIRFNTTVSGPIYITVTPT